MVSFRRSAAQLNESSTPITLGEPPMDIFPDISPPLQSRNCSRKIAYSFHEIIDFRNRISLEFVVVVTRVYRPSRGEGYPKGINI